MSNYYRNRERANFKSTKPSLTDQSQAAGTDINVIVNQFLKTGQVRGPATPPMYGDFTSLPGDLRGMIETSRKVKELRHKLPKQLQEMPVEELLALQPNELKNILQPPAEPPAPKGDEK